MNAATSHRGPDGTGVFVDPHVSLGHNRLSIIDLSPKANQPMQSHNGRLTITYNGELYNFKELKGQLEPGYTFRTQSDTEVILASYKEWGKECLQKFNGIFAFAIWDSDKEELFLARDHIGVKPFYYWWEGGRFIFSSEIKGILEHEGIPRTLNIEAFEHYMRIQYVPEPLTMFKGINKLPPAHYAVLKGKKLEIKKYWEAGNYENNGVSGEELRNEVRNTVQDAVKRQLVSDRPLGIFLSGGIDSSVILDCVAQVQSDIKTYSIGFDVPQNQERGKFNKDYELARRTARHYGTKHHEILLKNNDVVDLLESALWHLDEPISNATIIAQLKLSSFAKETVDVVLGGDGGDELFGGYERYRLALFSGYYQKSLPSFVRGIANSIPKLKKLNTLPGIEQFALFMFQKDPILKRVLSNIYVNNRTKVFFDEHYFKGRSGTAETLLMNTDRKSWLVDEALMRVDKMSMAYGLEARVPLLDREVVSLADRIPRKYKVRLSGTKVILRDAFKGRIPDFLLSQPKRGWFSPGAKWLRIDPLHSFVKEVLSKEYYRPTSKLFNWEEIDTIFEDHFNIKEYNLPVLWSILTFQIWARKYQIEV